MKRSLNYRVQGERANEEDEKGGEQVHGMIRGGEGIMVIIRFGILSLLHEQVTGAIILNVE